MSIEDLTKKIKDLTNFRALGLNHLADDLFLGLIIVLTAIGSFGLGRLSKIEGSKAPIRVENVPTVQTTDSSSQQAQGTNNLAASNNQATVNTSVLVASKSGTKYYYSWCSGAQKITAANRIYFSTIEDAKAAGYTPSSTCKGL